MAKAQVVNKMPVVQSAAEAFDRYSNFLGQDLLVQSAWHKEKDGRHLACGLGVLGDAVKNPKDCPAQVMPRWLAQMVPWMFDKQDFDDAKAWGLDFYAELRRLNGVVPLSVVHDWRANTVLAIRIETAEKRGRGAEVIAAHKALQTLHHRAASGEKISRDEWKQTLKLSYAYAYADAYAYAYADADADADAYAYADAYAFKATRAQAMKRMAMGLVEALRRVPTPKAA